MERIPLVRIGDVLFVSIQLDLHDALVAQFQQDTLEQLERGGLRGLVVDVSAVGVLDTFTARSLAQTAEMARLMGARMIVSGLSPAVSMTLTEMGFDNRGFETALDANAALARLGRGGPSSTRRAVGG